MLSADDIKNARAKTRETQAKFAERFGVDQSTIHRWEQDGPPQTGPAARGIEVIIEELNAPQTVPDDTADESQGAAA